MRFKLEGILAVLLIIFLLVPSGVMANSTPVYMENYPGFNIAPMKDSPIKVDREHLLFQIDERSSEQAVVTASYTMTNTSAERVTVPMIFPYVSDGYGGVGAAKIEYNGKAVAYEIFSAGHVNVRDYLLEPAEFKRQAHIDTLIENLNRPPYKPQHFDDTAYATLYEVAFAGPTERESRISFTMDKDQSRVLTFGFHGFDMKASGECVVSTYVRGHEINNAYILVLGKDTLADLRGDNNNDIITKTSVMTKNFIMDYLTTATDEWLYLENRNRENYYGLFIKEVDAFFAGSQQVFSEGMLIENIMYRNNVSALFYEVEFEAGSTNSLVVTYPMRATIDRRKSNDYVNTFAYILNPAQNFADFGGVDIQIELNSACPYIIDSSLPFTEVQPGLYSLSLAGLPSEDLVFSTYPRPEVTLLDATTARILPPGYGRLFAGFAGIFIGLAAVLTLLIKRRKN
jgi:hypothetical protein